MKTGLSILVVACCLSVSVMGQMKIENGEGNILVGNYGENTIGNAAISLYPSNTSGITRVSFNSRYTENQSDLDVFVGGVIPIELMDENRLDCICTGHRV